MENHAAKGRRPAIGEVEIGGDLGERMAGIDAMIETVVRLAFAIEKHSAARTGHLNRKSKRDRPALFPIGAALQLNFAGWRSEKPALDPRGLWGKVQKAADL